MGRCAWRVPASLPVIKAVFAETADALSKTAPAIERYFRDAAAHRDVGARLLAAWETGIRDSLGLAGHAIACQRQPTD